MMRDHLIPKIYTINEDVDIKYLGANIVHIFFSKLLNTTS